MNNTKRRCMGCMKLYSSEFDICPYCGYEVGEGVGQLLHLDPGTKLKERYLIGRALGYGGFGVTYLGFDTLLERKVAIKEYLPSEFATRAHHEVQVVLKSRDDEKKRQQFERGKERFLKEAQKLSTIGDLEGVVHIHDSFEENGAAYIVMEYLEGETLSSYLAREKVLSEQQAMDMMIPLLHSLQEVHEHGIIHRDIAPDNIFLVRGEDGKLTVKLIDFGASRYASASHSKSLTMLIKPGFSPAEQYQSNGEQGTFTDVYSIGAVLYCMVTGERPPDALTRRTQLQTGKRDLLIEPSHYQPELSENFENALLNALSVRVEDRTETAEAFLAELTSEEPVKRRGSSVRKIDFMKWPLWAKIGIPAAGAAVLGLIVLLACGVIGFKGSAKEYQLPQEMSRVPNLVNFSMEEVQGWIDEAELLVSNTGGTYSPGIPADIVLSQDISAGSVVMKNTLISVTVSTGEEIYQMPDVTGMTSEYAQQAITCMGVEVMTETSTAAGISTGCVISQSIAPYEEIKTGDTVVLTVADNGENPAGTVPGVVGLMYDDAIATAAEAGVSLVVTAKVFSETCTAPSVQSQGVEEGTELAAGESIAVTVELPWHEFTMPNLMYKTQDTAMQLLTNMGCSGTVQEETNELIAAGLVTGQSVERESVVTPETPVNLTVSSGGKPFAMPNVTGATMEDAQKILAEAGLSVTLEYDYSDTVGEGSVISQSVESGADVTRGTSVTLVICSKDGLITVDYVIGQSYESAKGVLTGQGLRVSINEVTSSDEQKGIVLSQIPGAGSVQREGATIVLTVGKGGQSSGGNSSNSSGNNTGSEGNVSRPNATPTPTPTPKQPGPWSDWSTSVPSYVNHNEYDIESKTQYRYRDRETTSSTNSSLSGWTRTDSSTSYGDYGSWSGWQNTAVSSSNTRQVETRWIEPTYQTQYNYSRYNEYDINSTGRRGWNGPTQGNWGGHYCQYYEERGWSTEQLTQTGSDSGYAIYNKAWYNESSRQVVVTAGYTQYRYRDREQITTYYYERWTAWSSYSDNAISENSEREVQTRTVYRYRTKGA